MHTASVFHSLVLIVFGACCSMLFTSAARAQYKIEMQTCEDLRITNAQ